MAATYEPIATTTLGSATSTITFTGIASSWTDLRVVIVWKAALGSPDLIMKLNNDSGNNYSETNLWGNGTSAYSVGYTNRTSILLEPGSTTITNATTPTMATVDIFNYAGSTYKSSLISMSGDLNGSGASGIKVNLWRDTSAINRIDIGFSSSNMATGTTATIYGILKA